jgi:hypothetical protein
MRDATRALLVTLHAVLLIYSGDEIELVIREAAKAGLKAEDHMQTEEGARWICRGLCGPGGDPVLGILSDDHGPARVP